MSNVKGIKSKLQSNCNAMNNNPEYRVTLRDNYGSYHYTIMARSEFEAQQIAIRKAGLTESDVESIDVKIQRGKSLCRPILSTLQTMDSSGKLLKLAASV